MSYHSWQVIWGSAIFLLSYTLVVFAVMETALAREKVRDGKLQIKRKGFVIKNLYSLNCLKQAVYIRYPRNLCNFFWVMFYSLLPSTICFLVMCFFFCVVTSVGFFAGYVYDSNNKTNWFKPYQRCGKNDEEYFVAPWKWFLIIGFMYLVCYKTEFAKIVGMQAIQGIAVLIAFILFCVCFFAFFYCLEVLKDKTQKFLPKAKAFAKQKTKNRFVVFRTLLKAKKEKLCPLVEIVDEE